MDNDELFRHLRRDHLYCHFCDADGYHHYYNSYSDLRDHFRQEHYLCEEGACVEEMLTSVFRSDIDLKAHKACTHGKHLGKAASRQARTLELEFTLTPRGDNRYNRRPQGGIGASCSGGPGNSNNGGSATSFRKPRDFNNREPYNREQYNREPRERDQHIREEFNRDHQSESNNREPHADTAEFAGAASLPTEVVRQPDVGNREDFPTLGNPAPALPNLCQTRGRGNLTIRGSFKSLTDKDFPALHTESTNPASPTSTPGISKTLNVSFSSNKAGSSGTKRPQSAAPNLSIQVNQRTDGTVTTRVSGPNIRVKPTQRSSLNCDFPALGRSAPVPSATTSSANSTKWAKVTCLKEPTVPKPKKYAAPPLLDAPLASFSTDFPDLSKPARSKKQSSIAVLSEEQPAPKPTQNGENNEAKAAGDATKGKAKKKKVKQTSENNSSSNESTSSKSNNNSKKENEKVAKAESVQKNNAGSSKKSFEDTSKNADRSKTKEPDRSKKEKRKDTNSPSPEKTIAKSSSDDGQFNVTSSSSETIKNNSDAPPRKRSELKIDSLNTTNNNTYRMEEEFPTLRISKAPAKVTAKVMQPPPGFGSATPPPPGFAVKLDSNERSTSQNSGLTFTNSSGESYSILPNKNEPKKIYSYVPPPDFSKRNKSLVAKLMEILGERNASQDFRCISGMFRNGDCSASDYYNHCLTTMGVTAFGTIFPEILALLPDIKKQQELFKVHKRELSGNVKSLESCGTCKQVLKTSDQRAHMSSHTMENHFPALGDSALAQPSTTWVTRKGV